MSLADLWRREIDEARYVFTRQISYHTWCSDDVLRALFHVHDARLLYEATNRLEGRVRYWERARKAGRVPESFDIEAQIVREIEREFPRAVLVARRFVRL